MSERPLPNVHPVDELQAIREEINYLTARADDIREQLLLEGADLTGNMYAAKIIASKRETVDKKALIEAFGEEAIAPYIRTTSYKTVKITEK
jgi:hypothetical protein